MLLFYYNWSFCCSHVCRIKLACWYAITWEKLLLKSCAQKQQKQLCTTNCVRSIGLKRFLKRAEQIWLYMCLLCDSNTLDDLYRWNDTAQYAYSSLLIYNMLSCPYNIEIRIIKTTFNSGLVNQCLIQRTRPPFRRCFTCEHIFDALIIWYYFECILYICKSALFGRIQ